MLRIGWTDVLPMIWDPYPGNGGTSRKLFARPPFPPAFFRRAPRQVVVLFRVSRPSGWAPNKVLPQDINASAVLGGRTHFHVAEGCVEPHTRACFATNSTHVQWEWRAFSPVHRVPRSSVPLADVKTSVATFARRLRDRQRKYQFLQE